MGQAMSTLPKLYIILFVLVGGFALLWIPMGTAESDLEKALNFLKDGDRIKMVRMGEARCFIVPVGNMEPEIICECEDNR